MTRAMAVTVLYRQAGSPSVDGLKNIFKDVPDDQYYADAVIWANSKGIVSGVSADRFDPSGKITREQMVAIFYRYAKACGLDVSGRADLSAFPDAGSVSAYALDAMSWAVDAGLIRGTTNGSGSLILAPRKNMTRAECATVFMGFVQMQNA